MPVAITCAAVLGRERSTPRITIPIMASAMIPSRSARIRLGVRACGRLCLSRCTIPARLTDLTVGVARLDDGTLDEPAMVIAAGRGRGAGGGNQGGERQSDSDHGVSSSGDITVPTDRLTSVTHVGSLGKAGEDLRIAARDLIGQDFVVNLGGGTRLWGGRVKLPRDGLQRCYHLGGTNIISGGQIKSPSPGRLWRPDPIST